MLSIEISYLKQTFSISFMVFLNFLIVKVYQMKLILLPARGSLRSIVSLLLTVLLDKKWKQRCKIRLSTMDIVEVAGIFLDFNL